MLNEGHVRSHAIHHTVGGKAMPVWASSSSSSNSSGQGSGIYSSFPSEPEFEQRGVGSPDTVEPKRKVPQPPPASVPPPKAAHHPGVSVQHPDLSSSSSRSTIYLVESGGGEGLSGVAPSPPTYSTHHYASLPQLAHQDIPFRKRMRREFRYESYDS
jgi:hypothetical protein